MDGWETEKLSMTSKLTVKVEENTVNVPKFIQEVAIHNGNPLSLM